MDAYTDEDFIRKPDKIKSLLYIKNESIMCRKELYIIFPDRYLKNLSQIDTNGSLVVGVVCVYNSEGEYSVMNVLTGVNFNPMTTDTIEVNTEKYVRMTFPAGSVFIINKKVRMISTYMNHIFKEIILLGKVPFYLDYKKDLMKIFDSVKEYTGSNIGDNRPVVEILISTISRNGDKPSDRYSTSNMEGRPMYVGLNDKYHIINNTNDKIVNGYLDKGLVSSLVIESTKVTDIDVAVRG